MEAEKTEQSAERIMIESSWQFRTIVPQIQLQVWMRLTMLQIGN